MGYRCGWGHSSYDPNCDMCDSETSVEHTGWGGDEEESTVLHKAALRGMTKEEYLENEDEDE